MGCKVDQGRAIALLIELAQRKLRKQVGALGETYLVSVRLKSCLFKGFGCQSTQQSAGVGAEAVNCRRKIVRLLAVKATNVLETAGLTG